MKVQVLVQGNSRPLFRALCVISQRLFITLVITARTDAKDH